MEIIELHNVLFASKVDNSVSYAIGFGSAGLFGQQLASVIRMATYTPQRYSTVRPEGKGRKCIGRHIRSRDNGARIMRWKIGPKPAQADRKNVLPVRREGAFERDIRYNRSRNNTAVWTRWNNFHAARHVKKRNCVCEAYRIGIKNDTDGFQVNHERGKFRGPLKR